MANHVTNPINQQADIHFDTIVLGGGAAGLMCALTAGNRGKRVLVLEVSGKLGKKILMSGGGRCNFTNLDIQTEHFICANPHFVKSALSQFSQWDIIALVAKHNIAYHEKNQGQLFCSHSAKDILNMLTFECESANVLFRLKCETHNVIYTQPGGGDTPNSDCKPQYFLKTNQGAFSCRNLVVATGGLSIPSLGGATGFGYQLAKQFGLSLTNTEASLVPMTLTGKWHTLASHLSGVAIPVEACVNGQSFRESLLFTHRGLSGPCILQLSNYWHLGQTITIDLLPSLDLQRELRQWKTSHPQKTLVSLLSDFLPKSVSLAFSEFWWPDRIDAPIQSFSHKELDRIAQCCNQWQLTPSGTEGYRTAEVTRGGVDVDGVSSKTMAVKNQPGLFMVGEVLDVTGHLGGYNFQWAWASGYVAGQNVS